MRISADVLLTCRGFSTSFRCAGSHSKLVGVSREEEVTRHHTEDLRPSVRKKGGGEGESKMFCELY